MVKDQAEVSPDSNPSANSGTLSVVNENTVEATPGPVTALQRASPWSGRPVTPPG